MAPAATNAEIAAAKKDYDEKMCILNAEQARCAPNKLDVAGRKAYNAASTAYIKYIRMKGFPHGQNTGKTPTGKS